MTESTPRHDGFTPVRQRTFLETLVSEGTVRKACEAAGMSREAAYELRNRAAGAAFALGWDAALLLTRTRLADLLMERAIDGQEDVVTRDADSGERRRHRHDNRLALSLLARLDRFADAVPAVDAAPAQPVPHADARLIAQDWEAFLDLIADGHGGAGAALFLSARRPDPDPVSATSGPCQLCVGAAHRNADADENEEEEDEGPYWEVWCDKQEYRTNFPPPLDFSGIQSGDYFENQYWRTLTPDEELVVIASDIARKRPALETGNAAREKYFKVCRAVAEEAGIDVGLVDAEAGSA